MFTGNFLNISLLDFESGEFENIGYGNFRTNQIVDEPSRDRGA